MSEQHLPDWYDDLAGFERAAWRMMARGVADRRHGFHTPTVSTVDGNGRPDARTVVLRAVDEEWRTLRFHTDRRAAKVAQLRALPHAMIVLYDKNAKLQVRVIGKAELHDVNSEIGIAAWSATRSFSRECYRVEPAPGSAILHGGDFSFAEPSEDGENGRDDFLAVVIRAESVEALYLASVGHRRARFADGKGEWLVP